MTEAHVQSTREWTFDDESQARVDAIFQQWDSTGTPGMAVGIYRDGEAVYTHGYGMSNLEHGIPVTPGSIFHIASISKQFTDTCIALLAAEGALDVDDDIRLYVPEVPDFGVTITIRHLIHHVSGLRDQWVLLRLAGWREDDLVTEDDVLELVKRQQELNFTPNDEYTYCNTGYTLLSIIVKRVSGCTLRQFAQERIFGPLGMSHTHFHDNHSEIVKGRTQAYQPYKGGGYRISIPTFDVVGTTSLFTTVEDLAKWNGNFTSAQVGGPALIEQLQTPGTFNNGKPMTYAWGLQRQTYRGAERIGHSGSDHGYRADFLRLPEFGFAVAVLSNVSNSNPGKLTERVADAVLGDQLGPKTNVSMPGPERSGLPLIVSPAALAGVYRHGEDDDFFVITSKDGQAWLDYGEPVALNPLGNGRFTSDDNGIIVTVANLDSENLASSIEVIMSGEDGSKSYTRLDPVVLDSEALDAYAGTYWSEELAASIEMVADRVAGSLTMRRRKHDDESLTPLAQNVFGRGRLGPVVRFERDEDGNVTGFRYTVTRVWNLAFTRRMTA